MAKKKNEEKKTKTSSKIEKTIPKADVNINKYSLYELLEMKKIKPLNAVGFLNYYGLADSFKKEFEDNDVIVKFSEGEFDDMYERYIKREI